MNLSPATKALRNEIQRKQAKCNKIALTLLYYNEIQSTMRRKKYTNTNSTSPVCRKSANVKNSLNSIYPWSQLNGFIIIKNLSKDEKPTCS